MIVGLLTNACRPSNGEWFAEDSIWHILKELTNAILYCQFGIQDALLGGSPLPGWEGVVHRDIKPANIFLCTQEYSRDPRVVLGDFGVATRMDTDRRDGREYLNGDPHWLPPEQPTYGFMSDVWATGAVIQAVCRLDGPPSRHGFRYVGLGPSYSKPLQDLIADMMHPDYNRRLLSHHLVRRIRALSENRR